MIQSSREGNAAPSDRMHLETPNMEMSVNVPTESDIFPERYGKVGLDDGDTFLRWEPGVRDSLDNDKLISYEN